MTQLYKNQSFTISHADDSPFVGDGLRAFFEYRDLNIKSTTKGKFGAHVIRAGSCAPKPSGIKHREVRHSDDIELIEIVSPADFATTDAENP